MDFELLNNVHDYFSTPFKQQIAVSVDEEAHSVDKALSAIIPAGLMAAVHHSEGPDGGALVMRLADGAGNSYPATRDVALLHSEEGVKMTSDLLGNHERIIRHGVAKYAGIKNESAASIMAVAIPSLLHSLDGYVKAQNLNEEGVKHFLAEQKQRLSSLVPQGFEPVVEDLNQEAAGIEKDVVDAVTTDAPKRTNRGWILPVVLAILAALLLIFISRGTTFLK